MTVAPPPLGAFKTFTVKVTLSDATKVLSKPKTGPHEAVGKQTARK